MPRGRTASTLNLSQRRERANALFNRGWNNADVARDIQVNPDTVTAYRREYEQTLAEQAAANPRLLINVIDNTVRALLELDELRKTAWQDYESVPSTNPLRAQYLAKLVAIGNERSKLFGLFGVKQEYFLHVQRVQSMQNKLLDWMRRSLCAQDRQALELFIQEELAAFMDAGTQTVPDALPAITVAATDV